MVNSFQYCRDQVKASIECFLCVRHCRQETRPSKSSQYNGGGMREDPNIVKEGQEGILAEGGI